MKSGGNSGRENSICKKKKMSAGDYIECSWDVIIVLLEHEAGQKKEAGGMTKEEG